MFAAQQGYVDIVRALLAKSADVNEVATTGQSALRLAERKGHDEIIQLLREAGAED